MKDLFRQVGPVIRTDASRDHGTGTVVFETAESVSKAVEDFNGFEWNGSKIIVTAREEDSEVLADVVV